MKKIIATTTINPPTEAIRKYDSFPDWGLLVVGDKKTPDDYYKGLSRGKFLPWTYVEATYPDLVRLIGWNSVRLGRMVAFIEAYRRGADILASIDDDVMPDDDWGKKVVLGSEVGAIEVYAYNYADILFDPLPVREGFWSRGIPPELYKMPMGRDGTGIITPLVWVDMCATQADLDAVCRLAGCGVYDFDGNQSLWPVFSKSFSPINTQNTFIHRSVIKDFYANIPFIGRADDIWAGYIFQALHPNSTIYGPPSATHEQERSVQSIVDDLEDEIFMYRNTYRFLQSIKEHGIDRAMAYFLPNKALQAIELYRSYFK